MKESDIVCTNPPFSLFREYFKQLQEYKKKFIILANFNSVYYADIRPYLKSGKVWLGVSKNRSKRFKVPTAKKDLVGKVELIDGKWYKTCNVAWLTNLKHSQRNTRRIPLHMEYDEKKFPKYDNYDAIEVSEVADIPYDYPGEMGVPITFLMKHNPAQFKIIGFARDVQQKGDVRVNGKIMFSRVIIKNLEVNRREN